MKLFKRTPLERKPFAGIYTHESAGDAEGWKVYLRRDTLAQWLAFDPVLRRNEVVYITDTNVLKVGDGMARVSKLPDR